MKGIRTSAVVAHFDSDNRLDPNFRTIIDCLLEICDKVILVTTCKLPEEEIPRDVNIITIQRPNIGYDFFSYRVGISEIYIRGGCDGLFVLNSSFFIINRHKFTEALKDMIEQLKYVGIVGITKSHQFEPHLQSYLLLIRKDVLESRWFNKWLVSIQPRNSKLEIIVLSELGLARASSKNSVKSLPIFRLSFIQCLKVYYLWFQSIIKTKGKLNLLLRNPIRKLKEFNPVHFAARPLAERYGIVKIELLRENPHKLDLTWLDDIHSTVDKNEIHNYLLRTSHRYQSNVNGLTILKNEGKNLPYLRVASYRTMARKGVKIAVLVHVFYPELIEEIFSFLSNILEPFDLIATTPHEGAVSIIFDRFSMLAQAISVVLTENRGRDIGPFLACYRYGLLAPYQAILKIHTKKSTYSEKGDEWRLNLYRELCGNYLVVDQSLELLRYKNIGIVGPYSNYLKHEHFWGGNKEIAQKLLGKLNFYPEIENQTIGFFAGSMFWFNPKALTFLHGIPDDELRFEPERGQQDGTLAHAFERIFCYLARKSGYVVTSVMLDGRDIDETISYPNKIPVLESIEVELSNIKHGIRS